MVISYTISKAGNEYNIVLRTNINNIDTDKTDDTNYIDKNILPIGVNAHKILYKNKCSNVLDNKRLFYNFIKQHIYKSIDTNIQLIPTYDKNYNGPNAYSTYMIKLIDLQGDNIK